MSRQDGGFVNTTDIPMLEGDRDSPVTYDEHPSMLGEDELKHSFSSSQLSFSSSQRGHHKLNASTLTERLTMMNIPTQEVKGAVYYGWLWKKGSSFKTWKKRFFLLNGCTLTYYTQSCVIDSDILGTQCLDLPAKGGLRVAGARLSDETEFGIQVTSSSGRVLHIQAGDQDAREQWVKALAEAPKKKYEEYPIRRTTVSDLTYDSSKSRRNFLNSPDGISLQCSTLSTASSEDDADEMSGMCDRKGWLFVRGAFFHGWKRRFVTLADGRVTISTQRSKKAAQSKTYEVISATPWQGHDNGFCLRINKGREIHLYAESKADFHNWIEAFKNS